MERVTGIGGFFFRSDDPDGVMSWYVEHLGITAAPRSYEARVWEQEAGPTVLTPFGGEQAETTPHGPGGWGLNLRVADLDTMVAQLRAASIDVDVDAETYPNGRFAQLRDPDGNAIQLWEPR